MKERTVARRTSNSGTISRSNLLLNDNTCSTGHECWWCNLYVSVFYNVNRKKLLKNTYCTVLFDECHQRFSVVMIAGKDGMTSVADLLRMRYACWLTGKVNSVAPAIKLRKLRSIATAIVWFKGMFVKTMQNLLKYKGSVFWRLWHFFCRGASDEHRGKPEIVIFMGCKLQCSLCMLHRVAQVMNMYEYLSLLLVDLSRDAPPASNLGITYGDSPSHRIFREEDILLIFQVIEAFVRNKHKPR